jgi:hypothetical protein
MPSKSKQQQKFMGMVHALQKGDMKPSDASPELKKVAKSMDSKDAKDFASTSHKGLPKKVKQEIARKLREYANKMGTNTMGGDSTPSAKKGGLRDFDGYDNVDYNKDMPMDEASSADAYSISRMLGTAQQSTQDFIDDNKIDVKKLESYIKKLSPSKKIIIKDIINGSTDKRLSTIKKGLIKQVKESLDEACWKGYKQVGGKVKNGKQVPNCVPESVEENFPSNWLQGRVSDYHTKKGTTKRDDYDDTNFNTKHSGQEDLEESFDNVEYLKLLNKAFSTMPGSPKQKEIIKKINVIRKSGGMKPIKEWGAISQGYHLQPSQEDKLDGTPEDKMAIDEVGVFPIRAFLDDMIPGNLMKTTNPKDKERLKSTIKDLIFTLNRFWKQHDIPYRVREK